MSFDEAFEQVLAHEGEYQNSPADRGNWTSGSIGIGVLRGTKYGISAAAYPDEDIKNLTQARAMELFKRDYWDKAGIDSLPAEMRFDVFDMAVNSGVSAAVRALQKAVGEKQDGILGPQTKAAIEAMSPFQMIARFNGARLLHCTTSQSWSTYGRGWAVRIGNNLLKT